MKETVTRILLLVAVLATMGCKKTKGTQEEPTVNNRGKIVGRWTLNAFYFEISKPGQALEKGTEKANEGDYFDFRANDSVHFVWNSEREQNTVYTIDNHTLKIAGEAYTILELTGRKLVFEEIRRSAAGTIKQDFILSR